MNNNIWIDTRVNEEEMNFLNDAISDVKGVRGTVKDKDNWFYETVLEPLTEKMFYREENNYYKYHIEKEEPLPKFELSPFWVNYQKQHEFNPLHDHGSLYSFVVFMRIPTHWKEQHALSMSANSGAPSASNFQFVWPEKDRETCLIANFSLSPEDEKRMLFFPATLQHMVYPFYECEEERVTISGNISLYDPKEQETFKVYGDVYEEKENILKMMQNNVEQVKKELKVMKKEREKEK